MVAKPPGGRPGIVGDEPAPSVGRPAFLPLPAALPALSWLSTTALVATPPESLRPAAPGPSLTAPPGRGTPASCFMATPACLATALCRGASPPAHARLVCFICCMMSLLFVPYLQFAPGEPATSFLHVGNRLPLSHTFHEHSHVARLPNSDYEATRHALFLSRFCGATPGNKMDTHAI